MSDGVLQGKISQPYLLYPIIPVAIKTSNQVQRAHPPFFHTHTRATTFRLYTDTLYIVLLIYSHFEYNWNIKMVIVARSYDR